MSGEIPDIKARITFEADGATKPLDDVSKKLRDQGKAATEAGNATKAAGVNVGAFGSTVGLVGGAIGRLNGGLGQTVTVAGSALGSMQSMMSLGFGPLGIAIGLASTALTFFIGRQRESEERAKSFTAALDENARSLGAVIARMREQASLAAQTSRLASGGGTEEEYRAEALRLRERRTQVQAQYGGTEAGRRADRRIYDQMQEALARADAVRAGGGAADEQTIDIEEGATLTGDAARAEYRRLHPRRGGGGGRRASGARTEDNSEAADVAQRQKALDAAANDSGYTISAGPRGKGTDTTQAEYLAGLDRNKTALETMEERDKAASESLKDIYKDTFGALQQGIAASMDAMVNGGASAEQAGLMIVAGLANQLSKVAMMKGLEQAAEALASAASYDYPGAAMHLAAAGAWTLVGAAAGAAGGALSAAAKPSGGGGPSTGAGPASRPAPKESEGARIVNVTFAGGVITAATEAQLGRTVRRVIGNTALGGT